MDNGRNRVEKLTISSGKLLVIDQFMLANQQLRAALSKADKSSDQLISRYGGSVIELRAGDYQVLRDPRAALLLVFPYEANEASDEDPLALYEAYQADLEDLTEVYIDTRCLVFSDSSLLENTEVMDEYKRLRTEQSEKEARDYLRSHGASVRYGFKQLGDSLSVKVFSGDETVIALCGS